MIVSIPFPHSTPTIVPTIHNISEDIHEDTTTYNRDKSRAEPTDYRTRLPRRRPLSGYRKQPSGKFTWQLKRDNILKCITKPGEVKITCSQKVDLDVGQGKHNPRLTLILYPNGLFINEGKSASLQAKITTPDKCPPLHPSLLVQLNVMVFDHSKCKILKETSTQETINMHSFFIHNLFTCDSVQEEEFILLDISIQIQKATEH